MVGHGGSSAGLYLTDPTSPIPSHCASIVVTSTVRVNCAMQPKYHTGNQNCALVPQRANQLTLIVLVATIDAQWEGMGDVGSARYEPALLPPYPTIRVLTYSNWAEIHPLLF